MTFRTLSQRSFFFCILLPYGSRQFWARKGVFFCAFFVAGGEGIKNKTLRFDEQGPQGITLQSKSIFG